MGFLNFLNVLIALTDKIIIVGQQGTKLPNTAFITFQVLNNDESSGPQRQKLIAVENDMADVVVDRYVIDTIQVDSFADSLEGARQQLSTLLKDMVGRYRESLHAAGYTIRTCTELRNLSEYVEVSYRYRWTTTITVSYVVQDSWQEEQMIDVEASIE